MSKRAERARVRTMATLERAMKKLEFVCWDRWTITETGEMGSAFGWIDRSDGWADFVYLQANDEGGIGNSTSSAEYSEEISRLIHGGIQAHRECCRIEADFPGVENVVRLRAAAEEGRVMDVQELSISEVGPFMATELVEHCKLGEIDVGGRLAIEFAFKRLSNGKFEFISARSEDAEWISECHSSFDMEAARKAVKLEGANLGNYFKSLVLMVKSGAIEVADGDGKAIDSPPAQ